MAAKKTTRLNPADAYTQRRTDGSVVYWRTGQGAHKHASWSCANGKRSLYTGDVLPIDASEIGQWPACLDCCTDADVRAADAAATASQAAMCPNNRGVANPQRLYSTCVLCGKEGKVMRGTGKIRAHKPA